MTVINFTKIIGVIFAIILFFTFIIPISFIPYDNYQFNYFSWQLSGLPRPPFLGVVEQKREFGSLISNGDHCDFFAALLVKPDATEDELRAYYNDYDRVNHPIKAEIKLYKVGDFKKIDILSTDPILPVQRYAEEVKSRYPKNELENLYIIYIFAPDYVSGIGDLRCG